MNISEKEQDKLLQDAGDAMRAMRESLRVRYAHFLSWMAEHRPVNEVILKVIRTFTEEEIMQLKDNNLVNLYARSKIAHEAIKR